MLDRYGSGRLTTAEIFAPAIELASGGFPISKFGADHFPGPGPCAAIPAPSAPAPLLAAVMHAHTHTLSHAHGFAVSRLQPCG